ncbi:unnamed protein product [Pleuronectes platessa]|uniref:Claudin-4-like n=1 Tax=Pleuronectes platessa TaxID=8262 RepID=A0A9N7UYK9_PLEPL|nr:unnamed protein product [Pleuronectes platessa]
MASTGMQLLAATLCLLGWAGVIISCLLPMWRVTAFVGSTIVTSQTIWEGIWMTCVVQSTGQMSCKPYDSLLALSGDLQAARALTVLAIVTGGAGLLLAFIGGKCTRFLDEEDGGIKGKVALGAGGVLIATGLLCLIPTSWAAGAVVKKFYSASNDAQRREIGACIYIGWGASVLLILGGGLFISSACPLKPSETDKSPSVRYLVVRSSNGSSRVLSPTRGAVGEGPARRSVSPLPKLRGDIHKVSAAQEASLGRRARAWLQERVRKILGAINQISDEEAGVDKI